jgi:prephenate dehydrogenase
MTRIGASDEEVWAGILYANKAQVLKQAERFRKEIEHAEKMLKAGKLAGYIKAARLLRESLDK